MLQPFGGPLFALRRIAAVVPLVLAGLLLGACTGNEPQDTPPELETCATSGDTCGPHSTCVDLEPGSFEGLIGFQCECDDAFAPNDGECVDVDECEEGFHDCDMNATCSNTEGAYDCTCHEGYEGDGWTCEPPPLSPEVIELAGRYLSAQQGLREAVIFGSFDGSLDLDGDDALTILDMVAARCIAHAESDGALFEELSRGCPLGDDVQTDRLQALIPAVEGECSEDSDCTGQSPGTPRCTSPDATCRCLPIGRSGLSECQPQFP